MARHRDANLLGEQTPGTIPSPSPRRSFIGLALSERQACAIFLAGFAAAWGVALGLRSLTLFGVWSPLDAETWAYLLMWLATFLVSCWVGSELAFRRLADLPSEYVSFSADRLTVASALLAIAGAILVTIEFTVNRGYPLIGSVADLRINEVIRVMRGSTGSFLGGVGRTLATSLIAGWCVASYSWDTLGRRAKVILLFATFIVFLYQARFEGGRFFFFALLTSCAVAYLFGLFARHRIPGRGLLLARLKTARPTFLLFLVVAFAGLQVYSGYVFIDRVSQRAGGLAQAKSEFFKSLGAQDPRPSQQTEPKPTVDARSATQHASPATAPAKPEERSTSSHSQPTGHLVAPGELKSEAPAPAVEPGKTPERRAGAPEVGATSTGMHGLNQRQSMSPLEFQFAMFWIYITHAPSEFQRTLHFEKLEIGWGTYQFYQVGLLLTKLTGRDLHFDPFKRLPSVGTYQTMAGASYIDFGWVGGLLFGAVVGLLTGASIMAALSGRILLFGTMAAIFCTLAFFAPIMSLITNLWPALAWLTVFGFAGPIWSSLRSRFSLPK